MSQTEVKFYYSADHNKSVKVEGLRITWYQVKAYAEKEISHSYGTTCLPDESRLQEHISNMDPCTAQIFESVVADYYNKERENADKVRRYLHKVKGW